MNRNIVRTIVIDGEPVEVVDSRHHHVERFVEATEGEPSIGRKRTFGRFELYFRLAKLVLVIRPIDKDGADFLFPLLVFLEARDVDVPAMVFLIPIIKLLAAELLTDKTQNLIDGRVRNICNRTATHGKPSLIPALLTAGGTHTLMVEQVIVVLARDIAVMENSVDVEDSTEATRNAVVLAPIAVLLHAAHRTRLVDVRVEGKLTAETRTADNGNARAGVAEKGSILLTYSHE